MRSLKRYRHNVFSVSSSINTLSPPPPLPQTEGKKAVAIEAFARALRMLPTIIADNAGYDSTELVTQLRAQHFQGNSTAGLDMTNGTIGDVAKLGIVESLKVKLSVLENASEAAGKFGWGFFFFPIF
jgi:chaperonin GroEL (HSP60 family)